MVALPASVTIPRPVKITLKLNMSEFDFLVLVLQSSKSSVIESFFCQFLFSLFPTVYTRHVNFSLPNFLFSAVFFGKVQILFFCCVFPV